MYSFWFIRAFPKPKDGSSETLGACLMERFEDDVVETAKELIMYHISIICIALINIHFQPARTI